MKKKRFTEEQIAFAMRQAENGTPVAEIVRKLGISEQTFYRWKKKYAGMGVAEVRRLLRTGPSRLHGVAAGSPGQPQTPAQRDDQRRLQGVED